MTSEKHTEFKIGSKTEESRYVDILGEHSEKKNSNVKGIGNFER